MDNCQRCKQLRKITDRQAELELWLTTPVSIHEAYLQQELGYLASAIEDKIPTDEDIEAHFD